MGITRHFLGWDEAVIAKVCEYLLRDQTASPIDLGNLLIIVPTRQAGRQLREALVRRCAAGGAALLSPRIETPTFLVEPEATGRQLANPAEELAIWAKIFIEANLERFQALFPVPPESQDFRWALASGEMMQRLRGILTEGGYLINDVLRQFDADLQEPERWQNLAELESLYLAALDRSFLLDLCRQKLARAAQPHLPESIREIVVAAVPDPLPLMLQALTQLASSCPISILVHAPAALANHFDAWGRPVVDQWQGAVIEIPAAERNLLLAGGLAAQSRQALELISSEAGRFGPDDIVIGVPDHSVTPFLTADLARSGVVAFDPAGRPLADHPLYHLLSSFFGLATADSYDNLSSLLRQADFLRFLQADHAVAPADLLTELDRFQNRYLPSGFAEVYKRLMPGDRNEEQARYWPNLRAVVRVIAGLLKELAGNDLAGAIRNLLQTIYTLRQLKPDNHDDRLFIKTAAVLEAILAEFDVDFKDKTGLGRNESFELLLQRLRGQIVYPDREGAVIDLDGWLELPWTEAPFLIITGMNEGKVPDSAAGDQFLPDSLRRLLKLRHDRTLFARDAYLLNSLIAWRRDQGRICLIAGKTALQGEPLKPSRLLFLCSDQDLPGRAALLFGDAQQTSEAFSPTVSFTLDPSPPENTSLDLTELPVTAIRDYLDCPFRFYLKRILGMAAMDDQKKELDALDFGNLIHGALESLARDENLRQSDDDGQIAEFLADRAEESVIRHYGTKLAVPVRIQLAVAQGRLRAAAKAQAELVRDGWEILDAEVRVRVDWHGMPVTGRIDRIDRHRKTGHLRLIDYKTSDQAKDPLREHLGPYSATARPYATVQLDAKQKRWLDLQLPLYILLLRDRYAAGQPVEVGYFNLAKANSATGLVIWENMPPSLIDAAATCLAGVVDDIRARRFWPPSQVSRDDYAGLFYGRGQECFNETSFLRSLAKK